jgi:glycosyltransferase involved in cell wall biosynthesis
VTTTGPTVGFVLERSLGHITHADNLRNLLPGERSIRAEIYDVPFDVHGVMSLVPLFRNNWTVRAGWRARRGIRHLDRRHHLDALFIHTQVPAVLAAGWMHRIPTIVSVDATPLQYDELGDSYGHEQGSPAVEQWKWRANRACFERAAHLVSWSQWAKDGIVDGYGVAAEKVTVVPPGVTPSLWNRVGARVASDEPVRVLFVGTDLVRKGGDVLIDAFLALRAELADHGPDVELHLVTKTAVASYPGVHVHQGLGPNSPALVELYHRSDVFCLPTRGDCLPMVLSEAGAAGLPLVSTAVAGIPEIVRDGETGLVIGIDDRPGLVKALRLLVEDPELRLRLGAGARRHVDDHYDAAKNTHRLVELLVALTPGEVV